MISDSTSHVPTQQSVKAYVDSKSLLTGVSNAINNRIVTFASASR